MKRYSNLIAFAIALSLYSNVLAQSAAHWIQLDDGLGHYTLLKPSSAGPGTFTFPSGSGTIMVSSAPGVSPAWMVGGNNNPTSPIIGTLTNTDFSIVTN